MDRITVVSSDQKGKRQSGRYTRCNGSDDEDRIHEVQAHKGRLWSIGSSSWQRIFRK